MTLFCKDWLLQQHNVFIVGLGGLLVNPIVDVGDASSRVALAAL